MPVRRGVSRLAPRPPRRRLALLAGGLGLAVIVAVGGGIREAVVSRPAALPDTAAAQPPASPPMDEEAPDPSLPPLTPDQSAGGLIATTEGHGLASRVRPAPTGPHLAVPILLYHYVRTNPKPGDRAGYRLSVTPAAFAAQVALLRTGGAHTVSLAQLLRALEGREALPPHPVILTFDDGYKDFATTAAPVLAAEGMTATAFVVGDFVNSPGYMSATQIRQVRGLGMTIGAHTMDHVDLTRLPPALARAQIEGSRRVLEELTGATIDDFAYPFGRHNDSVDRMAAEAGFRDAVTTAGGELQYLSERFDLRRTSVTGSDTLASFAAKVRLPVPSRRLLGPARAGDPGPVSLGGPELLGLPVRRR
jgi:peptidoglycan/xylan/chitin deacetylase (PgdA/CDA1 family)